MKPPGIETGELEYVGFWLRVVAGLIDSLLFVAVLATFLWLVYGTWQTPSRISDIVLNYGIPFIVTVFLWVRYGGTPGKMALRAKVVDADTGLPLTVSRAVLRYIGYYVSAIPLFIGLVWVAFDPRKQGWHDKMANSVVVRPRPDSHVEFRKTPNWTNSRN